MTSSRPRPDRRTARRATLPTAGQVLVTWIGFDPDDPETGGRLRAAGLEVSLAPKLGARGRSELAGLARDAVGAIVSTDPFERSVLAAAPRLRVIARVGVGTDSIDITAATEAGVVITTTPGANRETAADHALAMILAVVRRIVEHDASVRRGEWLRAGGMTPWDLHGTTVGLIGFGEIGRAVARRLSGFDTRVLVADPALPGPDAGNGFELVALDALLACADIVSLHLPLLATTRGIIGPAELAAMRPEALLVNTSRGGLVDEAALVDALAAGHLRGAALDVFADEPTVPADLRGLANVVLTPHVGGLSERSIARMTRDATDSVLSVLAGAPPPGAVVNPAALDHPRHRAAATTFAPRAS
jgi:D-3-phosphoglycerate dehydrogenase